MTAVTITDRIPTRIPDHEEVVVTATDGYTFTSEKFGTVRAVHATIAEDAGSLSIPVSYAISSNNIVTLHCTGLSANAVHLTLIGKLGN